MTDFAQEILLIAQRVVRERSNGRCVSPSRLSWAHEIIRKHAQEGLDGLESGGTYPIQLRRAAGTWEKGADASSLKPAGPFDGLAA